MSGTNKCLGITKSQKNCQRNALPNEIYCKQHIEIECFQHMQKCGEGSRVESFLRPDLEYLIMVYLTPYEYYELIGINKSHTFERYKLHQQKFETEIAQEILENYNANLLKLRDEYDKKCLKLNKNNSIPDRFKTRVIMKIRNQYDEKYINLIKNFKILTSQKLKTANIFKFIEINDNFIYGLQLDNIILSKTDKNSKKLKNYSLRFTQKEIREIIWNNDTYGKILKCEDLSPLWKLLSKLFEDGYMFWK